MAKNNQIIEDGIFATAAIVEIKDGKAVVILAETFGLYPGATIPLREGNSVIRIKEGGSGFTFLEDGHGII